MNHSPGPPRSPASRGHTGFRWKGTEEMFSQLFRFATLAKGAVAISLVAGAYGTAAANVDLPENAYHSRVLTSVQAEKTPEPTVKPGSTTKPEETKKPEPAKKTAEPMSPTTTKKQLFGT